MRRIHSLKLLWINYIIIVHSFVTRWLLWVNLKWKTERWLCTDVSRVIRFCFVSFFFCNREQLNAALCCERVLFFFFIVAVILQLISLLIENKKKAISTQKAVLTWKYDAVIFVLSCNFLHISFVSNSKFKKKNVRKNWRRRRTINCLWRQTNQIRFSQILPDAILERKRVLIRFADSLADLRHFSFVCCRLHRSYSSYYDRITFCLLALNGNKYVYFSLFCQ